MTQLQSTTTSILRTLRQAFETDFLSICRWDHVRIERAGSTKAMPDDLVQVSFSFGNERYRITVYGPDIKPPLGLVRLTGAGDEVHGPIDSMTFAVMAEAVRTRTPSTVKALPWD